MITEELKREADEFALNRIRYGYDDGTPRSPIDIAEKAYIAGAEPREKRIADLEKKVGVYQTGMFDEIEKRDKKLTEAKELIREIIYVSGRFADKYPWLMNKAEAFLKEVDK